MKKVLALLGVALIGLLAWMAAGPDGAADQPARTAVPRAMGSSPPVKNPEPARAPDLSGEPFDTPPLEPSVPSDILAPIAAAPSVEAVPDPVPTIGDPDAPRPMIVPVAGVDRGALRDTFDEMRGSRRHEAIDILAPRGTPVIATDDGVLKKLFTSVPGGLTVYQFDPDQRFCYYYAHLDRYAPGLHEGQALRRGQVLGYVGTTGNASKDTPHLHFALIRLDPERRWWKGTYVNPYPRLARR